MPFGSRRKLLSRKVVRESLAVTPKTGEALPKHRSNEYALV